MEFFFYGTLLDHDVQRKVFPHLQGRISRRQACLPGFKRVQANCGYFPVIKRKANGFVEGMVVGGLDARALLLMAHFEGDEYLPVKLPVVTREGDRRPTWVFAPSHNGYATGRPWDPALWRRRHKSRLLRQCDGWMQEYGARHLMSGDSNYRIRRALLSIAKEEGEDLRTLPTAGAFVKDRMLAIAAE